MVPIEWLLLTRCTIFDRSNEENEPAIGISSSQRFVDQGLVMAHKPLSGFLSSGNPDRDGNR